MVRMIFRNTFLVGCVVLLMCAALFFGLQYSQAREETYTALREETAYAAEGLALSGEAYLSRLDGLNRVTWISADGGVRFDSVHGTSLPSQADEEEVAQALSEGEGHSIRQSEASGDTAMYYALRLEDGSVLRLSRPMSAIGHALTSMVPMLWVLVLLLLFSIVLSFRAARQIVRPINSMDLEDPDACPYPELVPLVQRIQEQSLTIREEDLQREQLRREFSANVSHELRTPLTSISGFAELMSQGMVSPDKVPEFSADIYHESQRLIALVDDILRLSKLDENAEEPDFVPVDLYEVSTSVLDSLRDAARQQNVSLIQEGERCEVQGVWRLLTEMVYNLCDNAIKYNRPGGKVTISTRHQEDGSAVLTVADTGIGIAKEHQSRVFERFYRVDKSHSQEIGGTGLGLSIVKHGAQYHHAQVQLESAPGEGTTIRLIFPANAAEPAK